MRPARLFASIMAGVAALGGVASTTPTDAPRQVKQTQAEPQRNDTRAPATAPQANTVQTLRAGETVVPIGRIVYLNRRWNWVGRKGGGRFDFSCRLCAEPSEGRANRALRKWEARRQAKANRMTQAQVMELAQFRRHQSRAGAGA